MRSEPTIVNGIAGLAIGIVVVTALIAGLCAACD